MAKKPAKKARKKRPPKGAPIPMVSIDGIEVTPTLLKQVVPSTVDGKADCTLTYGMFAVCRGRQQLGTFKLRKQVKDDGIVLKLTMDDGQCKGFTQKVNATMHCKKDRLSTPRRWSYAEEMVGQGRPVALTKIGKTGVAKEKKITIEDQIGKQEIAVPNPYTLNWALYDAVGRLPRKKFNPLEFDLIDHFDQLKPKNKLYYRSTQDVALGKGMTKLHLFDHFGFGNLPWTYFVDDNGVVVIALAGLEAYGLLASERNGTTDNNKARLRSHARATPWQSPRTAEIGGGV